MPVHVRPNARERGSSMTSMSRAAGHVLLSGKGAGLAEPGEIWSAASGRSERGLLRRRCSGLHVIADLRELGARVVVLSVQDEPAYARKAFELGAQGSVIKDAAVEIGSV